MNATAARHYNQSFLLDDQMNDTFIISNDQPNHQNNSTTTTGTGNTHTGNDKMSNTIPITLHLNKDLDLHDKTIPHIQKNVHSQRWAHDDTSNDGKR